MSLLQQGRNVWRKTHARRAAFLVDGAAYFEAFARTAERARHSIFIVAWDLHAEILLCRRQNEPGVRLGDFLLSLLSRRPELTVHILLWDFAMIYLLERDVIPLFDLAWTRHPRLHFHMDGNHPVGACHHQKIVVVDDRVAFVSGIDLTKNRWDTSEHRVHEPRRSDPSAAEYGPFHDVQWAVEGETARCLGELARARWKRATGEAVPAPPPPESGELWPSELTPDVENVTVGISRTAGAHDGEPEVREVERLHLDAIAAAKHTIYVENQYFTSHLLCDALAKRLREDHGPEVVLILPARCTGWLEESTMGVLRSRVLLKLKQADLHGRLGIYRPVVGSAERCDVFVHSKVVIVDDRLARAGSSNLNNRSMGLDTECDLVIDSGGRRHVAPAIAAFRDRLLAEHLGIEASVLSRAAERERSVLAAIRGFHDGERTLEPLEIEASEWTESLSPPVSLIDPERAVQPELLIHQFVPTTLPEGRIRPWAKLGVMLGILLALAAAWQWTPLRSELDVERLSEWTDFVSRSGLAALLIPLLFVVGSFLMVPVTLLIVATVLHFDPWRGMAYSLAGTWVSALATYAVGHALGRDTLRRLAGSRLNRLSSYLARRGLLTVITIRILPLAPFTIVNMVAGASHIRFRDFAIGSLLGMIPGIVAVTLLENRIGAMIREPGSTSVAALVLVAGLLYWSFRWIRWRLGERQERPAERDDAGKEVSLSQG